MRGIITTFIFVSILSVISGQTNYCNLCTGHIACNNPGNWASTCPSNAAIVRMGQTEINAVLNAHNNVRNQLAGGRTPGFAAATQMMRVTWDAELAWFAELNVRQCSMSHDRCRATAEFPYAGQNLYWSGTSGNFPAASAALTDATNLWFNEYKDASQSDTDRCCGTEENFPRIGHFLQVAQDRTVRIGCAVAQLTNSWKETLIACNYSWGNLLGTPVYRTGSAGSACPSGRDATYTNLCL